MRYLILFFFFISCNTRNKSYYDKLKENNWHDDITFDIAKSRYLDRFTKDSAIAISKRTKIFVSIDSIKNVAFDKVEVFTTITNKNNETIKDLCFALSECTVHTQYATMYQINIQKMNIHIEPNSSKNYSFYTESFKNEGNLSYAFPVDVLFNYKKLELVSPDTVKSFRL